MRHWIYPQYFGERRGSSKQVVLMTNRESRGENQETDMEKE